MIVNGRFLLQPITGVQRVAREALAELDKMAFEGKIETPRVFLPAGGDIIAEPVFEAIKLERKGRLTGHLWEQVELPRMCKGNILLCLGNTAPIWLLLSRVSRVVTMVHDLSYRYFPNVYNWKFRTFYSILIPLILKHSDYIITVSKAEKRSIENCYPFLIGSDKLRFAQNGGLPDVVAANFLLKGVPGRQERHYGLYVGSLSKRKNAESVLRSASIFLETNPEMRFVVIGASSAVFDSFEIDIPDNIAGRLDMRGQVNDPQIIYDAFRYARFLVFPSFYEASPLPPIEAMTLGCPVISSRIPSLVERCGDSVVYCDAHDLTSIVNAIQSLIEDSELWTQKSLAGRVQAARYSWRKQAEILTELCEAC